MDLQTFISDPERKRQLADKTGYSEGYLWQVATSWRGKKASPALAIAIEQASREIGPEAVHRAQVRPDLWGDERQEQVEASADSGKGSNEKEAA